MSETPHTCPKCHRGKFTAAGLRSHRCKPAPSTEISVEVVKPEKLELSKFVTVTNLAPVDQIISAIHADHALFESHSKTAVFLALRIGLRLIWFKYNSPHGSLEPFIQEHFKDISRSSLTRYIRIADEFVSEQKGWRDKAFKLTDATKIAPILNQQLELFTDPNATLDIHCRQLVKWVDGRGLTQIYRDLGREDDSGPPQGHQGNGKKPAKKTPEQVNREAFLEALVDFKAVFTPGKWHALFEKDRIDFEKWITKAGIIVREYNAGCAKDAKKTKGAHAK